jgi:hypothetical protein
VARDLLVHSGDELKGARGGTGLVAARVNPDGEEGGIEPALAHARDVNVAVGVAGTKVEVFVEQPLRGIDVGINDNGLAVQAVGAGGDVAGGEEGKWHD